MYRYVLDGRLVLAGVDPYRIPPRDLHASLPTARLATVDRDSLLWRINHPHLATIYPPVAEAAFALLARAGAGPPGFRVAFALCDLWTAWALARILARRGRSPWGAALFALQPLTALESAGSGHVDALGLALLATAWERIEAGGRTASGLAWCAAGLVKPLAFLAGPFLFARWGAWRAVLATGLVAAGLLVLALGSRAAGEASGLFVFAEHWRHNDLVHAGLLALGLAGTQAKLAGALATGLLALALALRRTPPIASYAWVATFLLLVSPVLPPWYALGILVAAPVLDAPGPRWTAVALATVVLATYVVPGTASAPFGPTPGFRILPLAVRLWELAPVLIVAAFETARAVRAQPRARAAPRGRPAPAG